MTVTEPAADHRRRFWAVVAALVVICGTFLVLTTTQGPKLEQVSVDTAAAAHRSGAVLTMTLDRQPAEVLLSQVTVSPSTPVTVSTRDSVVSVQFGFALIPGHKYAVELAGVEGAHGGAADLRTTFTTPWAPPELGDRAADLPRIDRTSARDRVVTGTDSETRVLWTAPAGAKTLFVVPRQGGVVIVSERAGKTTIDTVGGRSSAQTTLSGTPTGAARTGSGAVVVSVRGASDTDAGLYSVAGDALHPVLDLAGEPQRSMAWLPVPGDSRVLSLSLEGDLALVDPDGASAGVPLGSFTALDSVSADGLSAIVQKGPKVLRLDLRNRQTSEPVLTAPAAGEARGRLSEVREGVYVQQRTTLAGVGSLVVDDGVTARPVFTWDARTTKQVTYDLSEDGRHVVVESTPADADIDFARARPSGARTVVDVIGLTTGTPLSQLRGSVAGW
ncbi:hypothetical protein [Frigoribacterium sp. SL97]|uniref:hypothetical protein n=1 Tax=Frigoribacterium sp. SL97 TaxID=2994664 RepID=UPI00226DF915|nr:hypothetical protein [Frigoribacterium sp. SL97]WAC50337.1 hypothetical protein OVA02_10580 [Frigoribacterium sp. SL97]